MTYEEAMEAGNTSLHEGDYKSAYSRFGKAHGLGHDVLRHHLAAHRGMLRAAWLARRVDRAAKQLILLLAARLFDADKPNAPATN